jgi:hypothetical protein
VEPIRQSRLVNVSFEGKDPQMAANSQCPCPAFHREQHRKKIRRLTGSRGWLTSKSRKKKKKLQHSEESLQSYRENSGPG